MAAPLSNDERQKEYEEPWRRKISFVFDLATKGKQTARRTKTTRLKINKKITTTTDQRKEWVLSACTYQKISVHVFFFRSVNNIASTIIQLCANTVLNLYLEKSSVSNPLSIPDNFKYVHTNISREKVWMQFYTYCKLRPQNISLSKVNVT